MDLLVEPPVGPAHRLRVAKQAAIVLDHRPQYAHLFLGRVARGKAGGKPLQFRPHCVKLGQLVVVERGDDQAAAVAGQHRLGFQPLQRLAHRGARHAETFSQFRFHQPVAGLVEAAVDGFEDQRIGIALAGPGIGHRVLRHGREPCPGHGRGSSGMRAAPLHPAHRRASLARMETPTFSGVETWVFDLDNTLYPPTVRLFDRIEARMVTWVMEALGVGRDEADRLRRHYWTRYGTTLAGLMAEHGVDPGPYLIDVHDIPLDGLTPDPLLAARIRALPGRRIVYTNGSAPYAARVLGARGLGAAFDAVYGVEHAGFRPKPERQAFETVFGADGTTPARAAMFEDDPRNLAAPHEMGMRTVHVAPAPAPAPHIHHHTDDLSGFLARLMG